MQQKRMGSVHLWMEKEGKIGQKKGKGKEEREGECETKQNKKEKER